MKPLPEDMPAALRDWLEPLQEVEPDAEPDELQRERRGKVLPHLAEAIRQAPLQAEQVAQRKQRALRAWWWSAAAAAALAVGGIGYVVTHSQQAAMVAEHQQANLRQVIGQVVVTLPGGDVRVVSSDTNLVSGEEISTTAQAFASVELEDQTRVDVSSATTLKLEKVKLRDNAFLLRSGRVDINVPKVAGETRHLSVRTADTLVTVRGTIFSVEVKEGDLGSITNVRVSRGAVAVEHGGQERIVRAGQEWSSAQVQTADRKRTGQGDTLETVPLEDASRDEVRPPSALPPNKSADGAQPTVKASKLKQQNQLFDRGLRARDSGDDQKAIYWFERLIGEHPDSPLLPSARAERNKASARLAGEPSSD